MQALSLNQVWRVLFLQAGLTILLAALLILLGKTEFISGLIGGFAATIANALFATIVFRRYNTEQLGRMLGSYYSAEFAKLALTAVIFLIAILFVKPLSIVAMLGIYLLVHLASAVFVISLERKKN